MTAPDAQKHPDETLFQLTYEFRPVNSGADYRLYKVHNIISTLGILVIWSPEIVTNSISDFL